MWGAGGGSRRRSGWCRSRMELYTARLSNGTQRAREVNTACYNKQSSGVSVSILSSHFSTGVSHVNFHSPDLFILSFPFLTLLSPQLSKRQAIWPIIGLFDLVQFK